MRLISFEQAYSQWMDLVNECGIHQDDGPMMSESWIDYTDSLCKDGAFNDLMYHHCPAWDDGYDYDEEDTFNFLCDCLNLDPEIVARDIEDLRACIEDSLAAPEWIGNNSRKDLSDLLDIYDELT